MATDAADEDGCSSDGAAGDPGVEAAMDGVLEDAALAGKDSSVVIEAPIEVEVLDTAVAVLDVEKLLADVRLMLDAELGITPLGSWLG